METPSIWHLLIVFIVFTVLYGLPMARIIRRTGRSRFWVIAFYVPLLNPVALWVLAFARWPAIPKADTSISN